MNCKVVGHRLVRRKKSEMIEVQLESDEGLKAKFAVPVSEKDSYPIMCEASFSFTIQQSLPLKNGEGGKPVEDKASRRATEPAAVAH